MQLPQVAIHAAIYLFMIGVLVTVLLVGAFLVVNLGMMSKRPNDRTGERTPSDVGILKNSVWPEEIEQYELPAETEEEQAAEDRAKALEAPPASLPGAVIAPDEIPPEFAESDELAPKRRKTG